MSATTPSPAASRGSTRCGPSNFVSGAYDLLVMVEADNMRGISDFVSDRLATMSGVKGTTTRVLMRRYKEDGVFLDADLDNDRQKVVF